MAMCPRADVKSHAPDQPFHVRRGELRCGEPHHTPAGQKRFEIFLRVGDESGGAIVATAAVHENAALNLNQRATPDVREISAPFAIGMKYEFALQFRPAESAPVERELRFEAGGFRF